MELRRQLREKWPLIIMIISAALLLFAGFQLLQYYNDFRAESALDEHLQSIRNKVIAEDAEDGQTDAEKAEAARERARHVMSELAAINSDYIGWITLEGTGLSYPIVQRDNEYYLTHDFEQKVNSHGAIFLDEGCDVELPVWLIHGHHMKDGTMFGGLKYLEKVDYLQEHTTLYFDAGDGDEEYQIYAAALIDFSKENESFRTFHYEELPLTPEAFAEWQNSLKRHSYWYDTGCAKRLEDISETMLPREILVLSTCEYGTDMQRLIVVAMKVEED